ncbi:MAG: choline dehydrogenase, partial [Pseudomonadota bacterium]
AEDYNHWRDSGAEGWGFGDVLPYFQRMEHWHGSPRESESESDAGAWRGQHGPLHITRGPGDNPLVRAFIEAGAQAGYPLTQDYNGYQQEGFGPFDKTVWKGARWSAAKAYLRPAQATGRCIVARGLARKILFVEGHARAVDMGGYEIKARREIILSASSINSPKLLMLSGIGPAAHLAQHGIDLIADRPGVGQNLQDHLELYLQMAASKPVSLFKYWNLWGKAYVGARWLLRRDGPGASNGFDAAGFIRSAAGVDYPDIQFHFLPLAVRYDGKAASEGHGFQVHLGPMRSVSRGAVTLRSSDPEEAPRILFNYMSDPSDWRDFRRAIRLTREILSQKAFEEFTRHEIQPGAAAQTDEELDAFIRDHVESAYHPCGTCKMGAASDPSAVVDAECRVIGVAGLRVIDSSIFPRITNGNLNAPSIMAGEKGADHILGKRLPASNAEPWKHPAWQSQQR